MRASLPFPVITITLSNRQRAEKPGMRWLRRFSKVALVECLKHPACKTTVLSGLGEVDVIIVSDKVIADVHVRFMNVEGATDVITFDHGEILISAQTARMNATKYSKSLDEEIALYIIHGLLHLHGYTDKIASEARKMHKLQEEILARCMESM